MAGKKKGSSSSGSPRGGQPPETKHATRETTSKAPRAPAERKPFRFKPSERKTILDALFKVVFEDTDSDTDSDRLFRSLGLAVTDYQRAEAAGSHKRPAKSALKKERKRIAKALSDCVAALFGASHRALHSLTLQMIVRETREPFAGPEAFNAAGRAMAKRLVEFMLEMAELRRDAERSVGSLERETGARGGPPADKAREILGFTLALVWQGSTGKPPALTDATPGHPTYLGFVQAVCSAAGLQCADRAAREGLAAWKSLELDVLT